ncbi:MAG: ComEC/Rec2 family competence protein [Burkholderiales bacterium]
MPYLRQLPRVSIQRGIDFAIISHADRDHFMGYPDVIAAGYDIRVANFEPGTDKRTGAFKKHALDPSKRTGAGSFTAVPLGFPIPLGDGARALVVAANGKVIGEVERAPNRRERAPRLNENDRSIALFIEYRKFHYMIDGDLGSGPEACTRHVTNQRAIQPRVAQALLRQGLITLKHGVDVLHIAHHGSESSTSADYFNLMKPEVGIISVGLKQGSFRHPRKAVVENVLTCITGDQKFSDEACRSRDTRARCVKAPPLKGLFQTDNGTEQGCTQADPHCVSYIGIAGGNLVLVTNGRDDYTITVDGNLMQADTRPNVVPSGTWRFDFDEGIR